VLALTLWILFFPFATLLQAYCALFELCYESRFSGLLHLHRIA
jgi:hypothetical protein